MKVLVVEDDDLTREIAVSSLEQAGIDVVEASTGTEALGLLESGIAADLLLTDIRMPGPVDGWEVAQVYRERFPGKPVIYGTGYAPEGSVPVSGSTIVWKPYRMDSLVSFLKALA